MTNFQSLINKSLAHFGYLQKLVLAVTTIFTLGEIDLRWISYVSTGACTEPGTYVLLLELENHLH